MKCEHDLAERETDCADGMCPRCLASELKIAKEALHFLTFEWSELSARPCPACRYEDGCFYRRCKLHEALDEERKARVLAEDINTRRRHRISKAARRYRGQIDYYENSEARMRKWVERESFENKELRSRAWAWEKIAASATLERAATHEQFVISVKRTRDAIARAEKAEAQLETLRNNK